MSKIFAALASRGGEGVRKPLRITQIVARNTTAMVALAVALTAIAVLASGFTMLRNYEDRTITLAGYSLAYFAQPAVQLSDPKAAENALAVVRGIPSIQRAAIYDDRGARLATWDRGDRPFTGEAIDTLRQRYEVWASNLLWPRGYSAPIKHHGKVVGQVVVWGSGTSLSAYTGSAIVIAFCFIAIALVIAPIIAERFGRSISDAVQHVSETAWAARDDQDFSRRVAPSGIAEIDHLGKSFNQILSDIEAWRDDITSLADENESLAHKAEHDPLTGLGNRARFDRVMHDLTEFAGKTELAFSLLLIDLDGFKRVNDRHGHPIGDKVLAQFGARLRHSVRGSDQSFRIGGDEFAVLLIPGGEKQHLHLVTERIGAAMDPLFVVADSERIALTISIGAARFPEDGVSAADLMQCADKRMYQHKRGVS